MLTRTRARRVDRSGSALAELAIALVPLCWIFVAGTDFARVFFTSATITTCAMNGALHASDAVFAARAPYATYADAAVADGTSLRPALTTSHVSKATGSDAYGTFVEVTITYPFTMNSGFLGYRTRTLTSKVRLRIAPTLAG